MKKRMNDPEKFTKATRLKIAKERSQRIPKAIRLRAIQVSVEGWGTAAQGTAVVEALKKIGFDFAILAVNYIETRIMPTEELNTDGVEDIGKAIQSAYEAAASGGPATAPIVVNFGLYECVEANRPVLTALDKLS